jgi:hypothetical protein
MRWIPLATLILVAALVVSAPARAQAPAVMYPPGWNLVAGPQGARLSGATGQIYTLQPGDTTYESLPAGSPLSACVGYWAYFPNGGGIDFGPFGSASINCSIAISPAQFVMMGNPSASANVSVAGANVVYSYTPDAGYQSTTRLAPGHGAWVFAAGSVSISTSAGGSSASSQAGP